jgi:acyl dehydratase
MADSLLERLKAAIGQELVFHAPDEIGRAAFRQYALAIGDFNPLYSDRDFAAAHGLPDVMAPPTLVCDTWQYVDSDMDERGDLLGRGPFRELAGLRAGNEYEFFQPVHPDDVLTARWLVKDVYERTGRSGSLIFQVIEATFYNQRGELLARNTETLFYRSEASE